MKPEEFYNGIKNIESTFIDKFKIGDNINYNLSVLHALYEKNKSLQNISLNKPIIVIIVSICEAIIYDFIYRVQHYTAEGVVGLTESCLETLRKKKIRTMNDGISLMEKLNLLQAEDLSYYDRLKNLAKLRNRIHIQNEKNNFEINEYDVFTEDRRIEAEQVLELLMCRILELYPRPDHIRNGKYVYPFVLPWKGHFNV